MKKLLIFIIILFSCWANCSAQVHTAAQAPATVYIIRSTGFIASMVNFSVVINDLIYCKLGNKRYSILELKPGVQTLYIVDWASPKPKQRYGLNMYLEAGKTYYLQMVMKEKLIGTPSLYFEQIPYNIAMPLIAKCKLQD